MSLIITKGFMINRSDYDTFDEIITFINEHNLKFTCFSAGSRKIKSKNARNLDYGNYCEFEFFYSPNHLSKLKKVNCLLEMEFDQKQKISLSLLNEYFFKYEFKNQYQFYQQCILYINMNINDYLLILYIIIHFYQFNGLSMIFGYCINCNNKEKINTIDFKQSASLCDDCITADKFKISHDTLVLIKSIFNNEIDLYDIKKIDLNEIKKCIKEMLKYLYETGGISLYSIKAYL